MKNILVVGMNYLGDALMTTPVHAALRRAFPNAQIDAIAGGQSGYGAYDILAGNPDIDNLIMRTAGGVWPRVSQLYHVVRTGGSHPQAPAKREGDPAPGPSRSGRGDSYPRPLPKSEGGYDAVVILPGIVIYKLAARLGGARHIFGPARQLPGAHMCDTLLSNVRTLVGAVEAPGLVLHVPSEAKARAEDILRPGRTRSRPLIGVNVGASRPQKRWPISRFQELVDAQIRAGRRVILLGGDNLEDREAAQVLADGPSAADLVDLVGKTTIMELAAAVERCQVLVTADTGAMHIAAAVGTPLVALFGSTDPGLTGPYGGTPARVIYKALTCAPCQSHPTCGGTFSCMRDITGDEVALAVNELLFAQKTSPIAVAGS